jgi:hypothetical protein
MGDNAQVVILGGDFVGRQAERQWLADRFGSAVGGLAVVVVGEAGVGKSRLLETGLEVAEGAGRRVLRGRALPGRQMPFRIFNEVFAGASRRFGIPDDPALVPFRGPLSRVVPDWPDVEGNVADALLVGEGALRLVTALGGGDGLVVALEDVHWADPDSLAVVEYLCEHGPGEGLVMAVTVRDEPGPTLTRLRALVARNTAWLRLSPLSGAEVAELCHSCAGAALPEEAVRFVVDHSDGLPYAVEELVAGLLASGSLERGPDSWRLVGRLEPSVPMTVANSVSERLAGLPTRPRQIVEMAAVLGREFDWRLLVDASGNDEASVSQALAQGREVGVFTAAGTDSDLRFRHALTREAVMASIPPPTRTRLARSALECLDPSSSDEACALAAQLAALGGDQGRSAQLLAELAGRMASSGVLERPSRLCARRSPPRPAIRTSRGGGCSSCVCWSLRGGWWRPRRWPPPCRPGGNPGRPRSRWPRLRCGGRTGTAWSSFLTRCRT